MYNDLSLLMDHNLFGELRLWFCENVHWKCGVNDTLLRNDYR